MQRHSGRIKWWRATGRRACNRLFQLIVAREKQSFFLSFFLFFLETSCCRSTTTGRWSTPSSCVLEQPESAEAHAKTDPNGPNKVMAAHVFFFAQLCGPRQQGHQCLLFYGKDFVTASRILIQLNGPYSPKAITHNLICFPRDFHAWTASYPLSRTLSDSLSLSILAHRDGRGGGGRGLATLRYMPGPAAAATSSVVRPSTAAAAAPGAEADSNSDTSGVAGSASPRRRSERASTTSRGGSATTASPSTSSVCSALSPLRSPVLHTVILADLVARRRHPATMGPSPPPTLSDWGMDGVKVWGSGFGG